jgi:hypothetical protein
MNELEIRAKITEKKKELDKLYKKRDKLALTIKLPNIKSKYEGKYFKSKNGYGDDNTWNTYIKVEEVISLEQFKGCIVDKCPSNYNISVVSCEYISIFCDDEEITENEFIIELDDVLNKIKK